MTTLWMWLIPWAANQTLARARKAAAVGDPSYFLHVQVCHVAGPAGDDFARLAVILPVGVYESAPSEPEAGEVSGNRAAGEC